MRGWILLVRPSTAVPDEESRLAMNWPYIAVVLVLAAGALGFISWFVATLGFSDLTPESNRIVAVLTSLLCLTAFAALVWKVHCDSRTRISGDGIGRPGFRGDIFLRWSDVREVRIVHFGIHLVGATGRVVVSPYAYRDPERVIDRVRKALRAGGHHV